MGNIGVEEDMGMNEGRKGGWINMFLIYTWALYCPVFFIPLDEEGCGYQWLSTRGYFTWAEYNESQDGWKEGVDLT